MSIRDKELQFYNKFLGKSGSVQDLANTFYEYTLAVEDPNFQVQLTQAAPMVTPSATESDGVIYSSAYETNDGYIGTHTGTIWEFATDSAFTNIVLTHDSNTDLLEYSPTVLVANTLYFVRISHKSGLFISADSNIVGFTSPSGFIATPTLTVEGSPSSVPETPILTSSAYIPVGHVETHVSTDWEAYEGATLVWSSYGDTENLKSIEIPRGFLTENTATTFKVRYVSAIFSSAYGEATETTLATFPYEMYLAVNNGTSIKMYGQDVDTFTDISSGIDVIDAPYKRQVTFSPDGNYVAVTQMEENTLVIYNRVLDTFIKLSDVDVMPSFPSAHYYTKSIKFSPNSEFLVVSSNGDDHLYCYKNVAGVWTHIGTPVPALGWVGKSVDVIEINGTTYAVVCDGYAISIYSITATNITLIDSFDTGSTVAGLAATADGSEIYYSNGTTPFVGSVLFDGATISASTLNVIGALSDTSHLELSADGVHLAAINSTVLTVSVRDSGYLHVDVVTSPTTSGINSGLAFNGETGHLAISHTESPYITICSRNGDNYTKLANPVSLPGGTSVDCAFYPRPDEGTI